MGLVSVSSVVSNSGLPAIPMPPQVLKSWMPLLSWNGRPSAEKEKEKDEIKEKTVNGLRALLRDGVSEAHVEKQRGIAELGEGRGTEEEGEQGLLGTPGQRPEARNGHRYLPFPCR